MAVYPKGLWLVLPVWAVVSRPSATSLAGSSGSSWWDSPSSIELQTAAKAKIAAGNFAAADGVYQTAFEIAERLHDARAEGRALMGMGGARMARFHYQDALEA